MSGFIPIKRSLFNHFLFKEKRAFSRFEAWLDLIQLATFQEQNTTLVKGKAIICRKGQLVASVRFLQNRWTWSTHKVSDFIELLRSQDMLLTDKDEGVNRITLKNFEKHNDLQNSTGNSKRNSKNKDSEGIEENEGTVKGTNREQSGDSRGTNIKKVKEGKNEKEEGSPPPEDVHAFERFQDWIVHNAPRVAKMREPFTLRQFLKLRTKYSNQVVKELLEAMHNWKDLDKRISAYLTLIKWKKLDDSRKPKPDESNEEYIQRRKALEERTRSIE